MQHAMGLLLRRLDINLFMQYFAFICCMLTIGARCDASGLQPLWFRMRACFVLRMCCDQVVVAVAVRFYMLMSSWIWMRCYQVGCVVATC